jgi:hypothetical protein
VGTTGGGIRVKMPVAYGSQIAGVGGVELSLGEVTHSGNVICPYGTVVGDLIVMDSRRSAGVSPAVAGASRSRHLGHGHRPCNGRGGTPLRQRAGCPRYGCDGHSILPNSNTVAVCQSGQDARAPRGSQALDFRHPR